MAALEINKEGGTRTLWYNENQLTSIGSLSASYKKRERIKIKYLYKICRRLHNRECSDIRKILQCWYKGRLDHIHFHLHTHQRLNKVRQTERNKIVKMC